MGGFNLQDLMSKAKAQYESLQKKMQETVVEASSGGGTVTAKMDGRKQLAQPAHRSRGGEIRRRRDAPGPRSRRHQRSRPQNRRPDAIHGWRHARRPEYPRTIAEMDRQSIRQKQTHTR